MLLDQFKHTAPTALPGCLECGERLTDLSRWNGSEKVVVWRCINSECKLTIFSRVAVPSFQQMRMI